MPRIVYVIIFVIITLAPFPVIWVAQAFFHATDKPDQNITTTQTNTSTNTYHRRHYSSPLGWFFVGHAMGGRGGWLNRSHRNASSSSGGIFGSSRSYSGGRSSFSGGSFGSFGK